MGTNVAASVRLMLVTDDRLLGGRDPLAVAQAAQAGGATSVQLRLKDATPRELVALTRRLVSGLSIPVLVNDRPDVALAGGAAGVHLGPDDVPAAVVRRVAPPGFIIGVSVGSDAEVASGDRADYWGIGPWRVTTTKADAGAGLGEGGFGRLVRLAGGRPCVAIGAVRPGDLAAVYRAGGVGVAVVSGILGSADIAGATGEYASADPWLRSE